MSNSVHVAVGVITNPSGKILIALRDSSLHQGGLWEFPGGKVEDDESVQQALARELLEEVNLEVLQCSSLMTISHDYGDKKVLLDVWCVDAFNGIAHGKENQAIQWVTIEELNNYKFPEANIQIIQEIKKRTS